MTERRPADPKALDAAARSAEASTGAVLAARDLHKAYREGELAVEVLRGAHAAGLPLYAYLATLAGRPAASAAVLPVPFFNVLNGGEHSGAPIVFQECVRHRVAGQALAA